MRLLLAVAAATLAVAAVAHALPGDPPIVALTPADRAALPANPDGVRVSFTCPPYTIAVYPRRTDLGSVRDYGVRFSRSSALGADGRLAMRSFGADAGAGQASAGVCTTKLDTLDDASAPEVVGGRVYWQAHRYCAGCPAGFETGPVRSFVVRAKVRGKLALAHRLYAGYPAMFRFSSATPLTGATVLLQRRGRAGWLTIAEAPFRRLTRLVAALPAGRPAVRVRIRAAAARFDLARRTVTVRRTSARVTSAGDDGDYRARVTAPGSMLRFRVAGGGTVLRDLRASLRTSCFDATTGKSRRVRTVAAVRSARIGPDGSVAGLGRRARGERILLDGFLYRGRYRGSVEVLSATCAGSRRIDAVRR